MLEKLTNSPRREERTHKQETSHKQNPKRQKRSYIERNHRKPETTHREKNHSKASNLNLNHASAKVAPSPAPGPSAALNFSQPRPWAELQGDDPGGRCGWKKGRARRRGRDAVLETWRILEAQKRRGPFIGAGQEAFRRLGLRAASTIIAPSLASPGSQRPPGHRFRRPGLSLGAAPSH
jgi:hypothetical protein